MIPIPLCIALPETEAIFQPFYDSTAGHALWVILLVLCMTKEKKKRSTNKKREKNQKIKHLFDLIQKFPFYTIRKCKIYIYKYIYIYIYTWLHFGIERKNLLLKIMAWKWKNSKPSIKLGVTYSVPPTLKEWQLRAVTSVFATMFLTCFFLTWQQ